MFLINSIKIKVNSGGNLSVLRLGDGDYYFLRQIPLGSAKPGRRALTKSYENLPMSIFLKRMWQNDFICPEVTPHNYKMWHGYVFYEFFDKILDEFKINFQNNKTAAPVKVVFDKIFGWLISRPVWLRIFVWLVSLRKKGGYYQKAISLVNKTYMPMEVIYALVSTKLIFRNYPDKIALIGAKEKLDVIKELVKKEEYKKYLGIEKFVDYIDVPQVGAADNIDELVKNTGMQVAKSSARIFLVAAGSAKLGFLSELKEYKDAIYIDIGCGMDALAGIVCQDRPYFASWVNYRLKAYDYGKVD
ncbi:MAG: hypothetical protein NT091_02565, partial [Candidatus Falkowbacteria bacterium]|nr:hypothetical protein [Candidatus Falkowbacteria bacterium]